MILADTSIWIDHLRSGNQAMHELLKSGSIVTHSFIVSELALGSLRDRRKTLALMDFLPRVQVAQMSEVRQMIEARALYSQGIGLTDAHLLASALINAPTLLWTTDKRLRSAAETLGVHADLP